MSEIVSTIEKTPVLQASKRMLELDIVKVLLIFYMIMDHIQNAIFSLVEEEDYALIDQSDRILQCINTMGFFVAGLFMFLMGVSLTFSRQVSAGSALKRANKMLFLALFINVFRAIPLSEVMPYPGTSMMSNYLDWICQNDILFFAAYFFYLRALTLYLKLDLKYFILILFAMFGLSHFLNFGELENLPFYVLDLLGHFVYTQYSSFPFLSWGVYPAFGILFGLALKRFGHTKRFYAVLTAVCVVLLGIAAWIAAQNGYLSWESLSEYEYDTTNRYDINWLRVCWRVPCFLAIIAFSYWLSLAIEKIMPMRQIITYIASSLTRIYTIQWCAIALIVWAVKKIVGNNFEPVNSVPVLATSLAVFALCVGLSWCWERLASSILRH